MQIRRNTVCTIEYTVSDTQGRVLDSSGGQPWRYLHGVGGIIPGMERALEGKTAGDDVKATLAPEEAYGPRDPEMVQAIPRENFAGVEKIDVGMRFRAQTPAGPRIVTVVKVDDQAVTVDANHPLAGQTIVVEAKVLEVREAKEDEITHQHVCFGDGACEHHSCQ
jgi:FKBP-type peptidyl-prolyl cis-trans isomerase SlyD